MRANPSKKYSASSPTIKSVPRNHPAYVSKLERQSPPIPTALEKIPRWTGSGPELPTTRLVPKTPSLGGNTNTNTTTTTTNTTTNNSRTSKTSDYVRPPFKRGRTTEKATKHVKESEQMRKKIQSLGQDPNTWMVFTDGGCKPNPGFGGSAAVLCPPGTLHTPEKWIESEMTHKGQVTNQYSEMWGLQLGTDLLDHHVPMGSSCYMFCDNQFAIHGVNGTQKINAYKEHFLSMRKQLSTLVANRKWRTFSLEWVPGHTTIDGNLRADQLASVMVEYASRKKCVLPRYEPRSGSGLSPPSTTPTTRTTVAPRLNSPSLTATTRAVTGQSRSRSRSKSPRRSSTPSPPHSPQSPPPGSLRSPSRSRSRSPSSETRLHRRDRSRSRSHSPSRGTSPSRIQPVPLFKSTSHHARNVTARSISMGVPGPLLVVQEADRLMQTLVDMWDNYDMDLKSMTATQRCLHVMQMSSLTRRWLLTHFKTCTHEWQVPDRIAWLSKCTVLAWRRFGVDFKILDPTESSLPNDVHDQTLTIAGLVVPASLYLRFIAVFSK